MNDREALIKAVTDADGGAKRAWQRMLSGRRLDLLAPSPSDVAIEDIAHGLARVARWNGQTVGDHAYSVAEHSLLVTDILHQLYPAAEPPLLMAALLHDGPEYVIGDLISPFKAAIGADYKLFELKILEAIFERFGIRDALGVEAQKKIKKADGIAAYLEAVQLAGFSIDEAQLYFSAPFDAEVRPENFEFRLEAQPVTVAEAEFLKRFHKLERLLAKGKG